MKPARVTSSANRHRQSSLLMNCVAGDGPSCLQSLGRLMAEYCRWQCVLLRCAGSY